MCTDLSSCHSGRDTAVPSFRPRSPPGAGALRPGGSMPGPVPQPGRPVPVCASVCRCFLHGTCPRCVLRSVSETRASRQSALSIRTGRGTRSARARVFYPHVPPVFYTDAPGSVLSPGHGPAHVSWVGAVSFKTCPPPLSPAALASPSSTSPRNAGVHLEMQGSVALSMGVFCPWVRVLCRRPPWVLPPLQPLNTLCQGSRSLSVCVSSCGHPPPQPAAPWPPTHTGHVQPSTVHHVDPAPWLRVAQGVISGSWKLTHTRPMITWG